MSFISLNFVVLFACTFILYHTLPSRFRKATLLTASCLFIGFYHLTFLITALIPHAYHLLPWQMDRTDQAGKQHEGNLFFRCVFSGRELVGIPVCRPAYRLPHPFSAGNLFLYFPGHFVPDRNLLARRTGKEPARLHDIHALLHEVPFRSHRKSK